MAEVGRVKKTVDSVEKSQLERWKATGVVALSESNLKVCRSSLEYKTRGILIYIAVAVLNLVSSGFYQF